MNVTVIVNAVDYAAYMEQPGASEIDLHSEPIHLEDLSLFEWIKIPGGEVTLIESWANDSYLPYNQPVHVPVADFAISRFPITNAQFAHFILANGYNNPAYWTDAGWLEKEASGWQKPRRWDETSPVERPDHPVIGVSWYEAYAFALWLAAITSEQVTLPHEKQWQRAAQGDDNRLYPWGDGWQAGMHCNHGLDGEIRGTTSVLQFPSGASPYGVVDMTGNVWEWCLNQFEIDSVETEGTAPRLLRGGSWGDGEEGWFMTTLRYADFPNVARNTYGFRVVMNWL
jgi:formylglycine-generating enzyme required for sulfatase activity